MTGTIPPPLPFSRWLKRRRAELGLTQEALAERVFCAVQTVRMIEQGARRPSREMAERLAEVLELAPDQRAEFVRSARAASPTPAPDTTAAPPEQPRAATRLPAAPNRLIDREAERAEIAQRLADPACRLITLAGPGGIGKTRLALQVATDLAAQGGVEVAWIPLAALDTAARVPVAVADALGLMLQGAEAPAAQLASALHDRALLLALDNAEHLPDLGPLLAWLLEQLPRLRLLVTTRQRLSLAGEWLVQLGGLPVPSAVEEDRLSAAAELFVERARQANGSFALGPADRAAVAQICQLLDGSPLGIELAATWARSLTPGEIACEIARGLDFLARAEPGATARHSSLRAIFEHSWRLLSADERRVLRRLAVFRGAWTREAAEAVSASPDEGAGLLGVLSALVDKSLVHARLRAGVPPRYELHETVRQFAGEQLQAAGEAAQIHERHLGYYLRLAEAAEPELQSAEQERWLTCLAAETANLRAALAWALGDPASARSAAQARRLAGALWRFWYLQGALGEGRQWLEQALAAGAALGPPELMSSYQARLLLGSGALAWGAGDTQRAGAYLRASLALYEAAGDQRGIAEALQYLGVVAGERGDYALAVEQHQRSLQLRQALGDLWGCGASLNNLGMNTRNLGDEEQALIYFEQSLTIRRALGDRRGSIGVLNNKALLLKARGDFARARALLEEAHAISQALGDRWNAAYILDNLGGIALAEGDPDRATESFAASLTLSRELGDQVSIAYCLEGLAHALLAQGGYERAARLLGAADALRERAGAPLPPVAQAGHADVMAELRARLGAAQLGLLWQIGRAQPLDQAIAAAPIEDSSSL